MSQNNLKLYIIIPVDIPIGHAINSAAHVVLKTEVLYNRNDLHSLSAEEFSKYYLWRMFSFKKVTCVVTRKEFNNIKNTTNCVVFSESKLKNIDTALCVIPSSKKQKELRKLPLFSIKNLIITKLKDYKEKVIKILSRFNK